jgi:hypothetical protein
MQLPWPARPEKRDCVDDIETLSYLNDKKENAEMNYGEVLSRAWQIIWKHKALWIFGILAGCGNVGGSSSNVSYQFTEGDLSPAMQNYFQQFERIPDWQVAGLIGIAILVTLVLVLLAIFLSTMGRIGMIRGTQQADAGAARLSFGELFRGSLTFFWRVFLLNLLIGLVVFVVVFVAVIVAIAGTVLTLGLGILCLLPLLCLIIPLSWLLYVLIEQANIAIVVENLGVIEGWRRGWQVFKENLGTMIVMGLILYLGVALIGGLIIGIPVILFVLPALVAGLLGGESAFGSGLLVAGLCFVMYLPVWIVLNGILTSYIESAWTLTYLRLTGRKAALEPVSA